jgi:hypothetical protein
VCRSRRRPRSYPIAAAAAAPLAAAVVLARVARTCSLLAGLARQGVRLAAALVRPPPAGGHAAGAAAPPSPVVPGSVEADWLGRARRAAATFGEIALGLSQEPLADRAVLLRFEMTETVGILERLAVRSSVAARVLGRSDVHALGAEAALLRAEQDLAGGTTAALVGRSLAATEARIDLHHQLRSTRDGVLARLELGVVHLERITERMTTIAVASVLAAELPVAELAELHESLAAIRPGLLADEPDHGVPVPLAGSQPGQAAAG